MHDAKPEVPSVVAKRNGLRIGGASARSGGGDTENRAKQKAIFHEKMMQAMLSYRCTVLSRHTPRPTALLNAPTDPPSLPLTPLDATGTLNRSQSCIKSTSPPLVRPRRRPLTSPRACRSFEKGSGEHTKPRYTYQGFAARQPRGNAEGSSAHGGNAKPRLTFDPAAPAKGAPNRGAKGRARERLFLKETSSLEPGGRGVVRIQVLDNPSGGGSGGGYECGQTGCRPKKAAKGGFDDAVPELPSREQLTRQMGGGP